MSFTACGTVRALCSTYDTRTTRHCHPLHPPASCFIDKEETAERAEFIHLAVSVSAYRFHTPYYSIFQRPPGAINKTIFIPYMNNTYYRWFILTKSQSAARGWAKERIQVPVVKINLFQHVFSTIKVSSVMKTITFKISVQSLYLVVKSFWLRYKEEKASTNCFVCVETCQFQKHSRMTTAQH